jgi:hypothetical protein
MGSNPLSSTNLAGQRPARTLIQEQAVASQQKLSTKAVRWPTSSGRLVRSRPCAAGLAHLVCMETTTHPQSGLGPVLTLSQLAAQSR